MMKTRIILVFLILCNIVSAQNYKISYIHYYDTDWPKTTPGFLFIDTKSNNILYLYQYSKSQDWKEKIGQDFPYSNKVGYDGSLRDQYFKIDNNRMITTTDYIGGEKVIITDIPSKIEWNLSREKKEIANYTCYKATTIFRGRKWEAWYTNDIPLSYGPLKFAGLPGLILEISDDTKEYTIMAEQIVRTSENFVLNLHYLKIQPMIATKS